MPGVVLFTALLAVIMSFLPRSPFAAFIVALDSIPYLSYLNWFIPVSEIISVLQAWIAIVAVYYVYSAIMRWIKMIG